MKFQTPYKVILASQSPRRKELFSTLSIPFDIVTSDVEETSVQAETPELYVKEVALLKTRYIAAKYTDSLVIGADTIVVFDNKMLHKPKDEEEAFAHLSALSNNVHTVMTAVAIMLNGKEHVFVEKTKVYFKEIPQSIMQAYITSGDCYDKAGGYGIQTDGALFVEKIEGDYNNVVGLPLASLVENLMKLQLISI